MGSGVKSEQPVPFSALFKGVGGALRGAPTPVQYDPPGLGRLRKIALIGTAGTVRYAPWHDPSWEIWAHASAMPLCERADRFFDLHPKHIWTQKKKWHVNYQEWLRRLNVPIYMQQHYKDVPASVRYPKEMVMAEYPWRYFTSQVAWMIALALSEGVTHLGFFGIHYAANTERVKQRSGCEFWMGLAAGKGVQLVIPQNCPLLKEPKWLYGYESHEKGRWKEDEKPPRDRTMVIDDGTNTLPPLMALRDGEEPATSRSPWAKKE